MQDQAPFPGTVSLGTVSLAKQGTATFGTAQQPSINYPPYYRHEK